MVVQIVFPIILLLGSINTFLNAASLAKPSCQAYCGNISIPYPFGIGADCYYDDWYAISCKENFDFLRIFNLEVLEISLQGTVRINHPIFSSCTNSITTSIEIVDFVGSPFSFSYHNRFIAIGCNIYASMKSPHGYVIAACISASKKFAPYSYSQGCYGFKCCQTTIPQYPGELNATIETRNTAIIDHALQKTRPEAAFWSRVFGKRGYSLSFEPRFFGMQLGKSQKTNQFLESLKAEGEVILEDVQPKASQSRSAAPPLTDPITLTVEEKLNVTLKRDGGVSNFDVQGTLGLQILNQEDGHIQVQLLCVCVSVSVFVCLWMPVFIILVFCYCNIIV